MNMICVVHSDVPHLAVRKLLLFTFFFTFFLFTLTGAKGKYDLCDTSLIELTRLSEFMPSCLDQTSLRCP